MSWLNSFNYYTGKRLINKIRFVILENNRNYMKF